MTEDTLSALFLLGRIFFGSLFAFYGINQLVNLQGMTQYAASKGVPMPEMAVIGTAILILLGGLSIILGFRPHIGAACVALFLTCITPTMHDFWNMPTAGQRAGEMAHFMKNVALLGGALMMIAARWRSRDGAEHVRLRQAP